VAELESDAESQALITVQGQGRHRGAEQESAVVECARDPAGLRWTKSTLDAVLEDYLDQLLKRRLGT